MADNRDDGSGIGSTLKGAATIAPAVAGGVMSYGRIRSAWEEIAAVTEPGQVHQTQEAIRKFASEYISEDPTVRFPASKSWKVASYVNEIQELSETSSLSVSQIREIVSRIAQKADPTGRMPIELTERLSAVGTTQEAFGALNLYLSGTTSIYTRRASKLLAQDLTDSSARLAAGLPIDTVSWTGKIPRIKSTLKPTQWESALGSKMSRDLERIQQMTGADIGVSMWSRKDIAGEELQLSIKGGNIPGEIKLKIPRVLRNQYTIAEGPLAGMGTVIKSGSTQQSRRITGVYGLVENRMLMESFNHEEWMMRRAAEEVIPHILNNKRLSQREINRITREFEAKSRETAEWIHSVKGFEATEEYIAARSPMIRLYETAQEISPRRSRSALQYAEKYASVDVSTLAGLVERGGADLPGEAGMLPLFPGPGPTQAAGGIAALVDPRQRAGLMPSAVPTIKRPLQPIRPNWSPTELARQAMAANPINEEFGWAARADTVESPMLKAAFVSSKYQHMLEGTGVHAEGQFLLAERRAAELAVDEITQFKIDASKIGPDLANLINTKGGAHWDIGKTIEKGSFLGYDTSGARITTSEEMRLLHATAFGDKEEGNFIRVVGTKELRDVNWAKYFGIKATASLKSDEQIAAVLKRLEAALPPGARPTMGQVIDEQKAINREKFANISEDLMAGANPEELEEAYAAGRKGARSAKKIMVNAGVDAIFMADELKKNRSLHYNQMFTALWDFNRARMQSGKQMAPDIKAFQADPLAFIGGLEEQAKKLPVGQRDVFKMGKISALARELIPEEMGGVFGAVPEAMEDIGGMSVLGPLSKAQQRAIQNTTAVGYTQLFFGGAGRETGAGTRASLEPRTMELLQGPAWGELGPQVQEDIMKRMVKTYPERLFEQRELMTSLSSMQKLGTRKGAIGAAEMLKTAGNKLLMQEGADLRIPGVGDIYIPGASTIRQLASYQTPSKKMIDMPLAHSYRDLIETAKAYEGKNITRDVLDKKISEVVALTGQSALGTITAHGGLMRNKIPGSAYLRAEDIAIGMKNLTADVGISEAMGNRMFGEMEQMGIYGKDELALMRERFEMGKSVAGIVQRDPSIGPYSVQAVTMQKIKGAGKAAIFREQRYKSFATPGIIEDIAGGKAFLSQAREAIAQGKGFDTRLSPLVGMAGDFDADNVALMFSGPRLEEALRRMAGNTLEYENYIIRQQMLKAKATSTAIEAGEEMAGSIYSMSVTGGKNIGRLSVKMQEYRAAVLMGAGGLSHKEGLDALSLLEWLEQVPIASKHTKKGKEATTLDLLSDIDVALGRKDAAGITSAVDLVMGEAKAPNRAALFEGATVAMQGPSGSMTVRKLKGLGLTKTTQNIVRARQAMDATEEGKMVSSRIRQMFFNKGPAIRAEEAFSILSPEFTQKSIFGSLIQAGQTSKPKGVFASLSSRALAAKNRMGVIGKGMLEHARPLAMGLGISMGLSLLLSEPPRVLEPGATVPPQPNMRSGSGGDGVTNVHPQGVTHGSPSVPPMTSVRQTARVGSGDGFNINIRAGADRKINYRGVNNQLRQMTGGRTQSNTNVRDQRSSLTPQKLSDILRGR